MPVVERTETHVQCECPPSLCTHAPDFYRVVHEWGVWDDNGNVVGIFDTKSEADAAAAALETTNTLTVVTGAELETYPLGTVANLHTPGKVPSHTAWALVPASHWGVHDADKVLVRTGSIEPVEFTDENRTWQWELLYVPQTGRR